MRFGVAGAIVAGTLVGGALSVPVLIDAAEDPDDIEAPEHADDGGEPGEDGNEIVVARFTSVEVGRDLREVTVITADPLVSRCTVPEGVEVELDGDLAVIAPRFRLLPPEVLCEQACNIGIEMTTRLTADLPDDVTFVSPPDAVETCETAG